MSDISILGWTFRGVIALLAVVALALAIGPGSRVRRLVSGGVALVLILAFVAAWVNAHFEYYRTAGELFGQTSADQASVESLSRQDVPPNGEVVTIDIPNTASGFQARQAQVWVPPAWFGTPKPKLPVIMMLHGSPGAPADWTRGGLADQTADAFADQHQGVAPLLVMPDPNGGLTADTECVDGPRGKSETYLTVDVRNYVIQRFDTASDAKSWAVAGFSAGGNCSVQLALRHPDLWNTFGDFGGLLGPRSGESNDVGNTVADLFGGNQQAFEANEPTDILRSKRFAGMGGWFEVSIDDPPPHVAINQLAPLAKAAGIETCVVVLPSGDHTFASWSQAFRDSLPWFAARLGLIPMTPALTQKCTAVN